MNVENNVQGKSVLITGVTAGLGREIARVFVDAGADVYGLARRSNLGQQLEDELKSSQGGFTFFEGDVQQRNSVSKWVTEVNAASGQIDILINNAGTWGDPTVSRMEDVSESLWDEIMDTNMKGTFNCSQAGAAIMMSQGHGAIWNIASSAAIMSRSGMVAYCASKAGVVQLSRAMAVEFADSGISVNCILLGGTRTSLFDRLEMDMPDFEIGSRNTDAADISRYIYQPRAVANAILALCHPNLNIMTGASIAIDHGITAGLLNSERNNELWTLVKTD